MISGTVSREDMFDGYTPDLFTEDGQFLVRHFIEMQTAHVSANIAAAQFFPDILQNIRHSDMGAAVKDDQALPGFNDQTLFMCKIVRMPLAIADGI